MNFTVTLNSLFSRQCKTSLSFVSLAPRSVAIWGRVVFATQETSPYDIAVVSLEEDLEGVPMPVPTEHFHEGKGQRVQPEGGPSGLGWTSGRRVRVD